ncbi:class II aldolase/adducin family protein [Verticiella sediminum]|uniref:Class II aldolase/adducin family protein n=1 Tax=Verticiella sediminum TaxID=1247510 RepID=A0A556A800_9BURK|nr:class II aldolase/adducin family protein [Verticiella sediminum]TSH89005.1 class II aldolase/adducin family protein [Verticiella sediminum]
MPVAPIIELPSMQDQVSPAEWQTRVDLAACYRLVEMVGMADMVNSHISARIPDTEHFLINPYGWLFDEITASSLVKIDLDGNIVGRARDDLGINPAGFVVHSAVHAARPDVGCVIHTHTRAGCAVASLKCGLLPISQKAMRFYGHIGYHPYESVVVNLDERKRLAEHLGDKEAMILLNHGLLTANRTIQEGFNTHLALNRACEFQVDAMACGTELVIPSDEVKERTAHLFRPETRRPYGILEWPALLRLLERRNPGYDA